MAMDWQQIRSLIAGAVTMLVMGSLYVYGGIAPYLVSDLYYKGNTDISAAKLSIVLTLSIITTNAGIFLSSLKKLKFNYRLMALISICGISGSTYSLSYMNSLYTYIFFYGICFGMFIGYGYLASVRNCYDYLPNRKGLGSGVCMMGFGFGPVIFTMVLTQLINPKNLSVMANKMYPEQVALNVPSSLRTIAIIYLVIGSIGVLLLKPKSKDKLRAEAQAHKQQQIKESLIQIHPILMSPERRDEQQQPIKEENAFEPEDQDDADVPAPIEPHSQASPALHRHYREKKEEKEVVGELNEEKLSKRLFLYLFKKDLHMLVTILSLSASFGLFLAFNYKNFGFTSIKNDKFMSVIGSLGSLANSMSRFMWGYLFDKYSYRTISTIINSCLLFCCIFVDYAVESQIAYLLIVVVVYGCFGGNYSVYPPQTVKMLGKVLGSKVYFVTYTGFSIGAIFQYICSITLVQKYGREGYTYCWIIFAGMLILSIFYGLTVDFCSYEQDQKKKRELVRSPEIELSPLNSTALKNY